MTEAVRTQGDQRPIIVGVDGSPGAVAALRWAADEAKVHGSPVTVISVKDLFVPFPVAPAPEVIAVIEHSSHAALDEALTEVYGTATPDGVTRVVEEGNPAQVLIDASQNASMLVVGERGRGSFLIGSVTDRCVRHAMSTVVVVR